MRKYYYVYKITCLCGSLMNHYYFGQHRTDNLNDGYAGSGNILQLYYKKYGKIEGETFIKEILGFAKDGDSLNDLEFEVIGHKFKDDPMCINLRGGGYCSCGDYNNFYGKHHTEEAKRKMSDSRKGKTPWIKGKTLTEEQKQLISENTKKGMHKEESWNRFKEVMNNKKGTHLSNEHKQKISDTFKKQGHPKGFLGKHHTEETKKRIGENNHSSRFAGHKHSEETKKKMSNSHKGKHVGKVGPNAGRKRVYNEDGTYKYILIN